MFQQFFIQTGLHYLHQCWASRSLVSAWNPYTCPRPDSFTKPRNRYWQHSRPTDLSFSQKILNIGKQDFQTPSGNSSANKKRGNLGQPYLVLYSELKTLTKWLESSPQRQQVFVWVFLHYMQYLLLEIRDQFRSSIRTLLILAQQTYLLKVYT